jgi:hypothetical protein
VYRFASLLLSGRFDHGTDTALKLPHIINSKEKIDSAGNIRDGYQVAFKYFPTDVQTTCNSVGSRLRGDAERFIKLLRWQQEIDGPHVLFEGLPPLYWNAGGTEYWAVGFPVQGRSGRSPVGITWDADDHREMQGIWAKADIVEPLAHELLREAKGAMGSSPRSALLIAASAVEAGLKVPDLHSRRGKPFPEWNKLKPLFKIINELAEDRNTLTHKGEMPERAAVNLPQALAAVSDLLYIFDVLEGHDWAKCNVQFSTIKLLGWPKPRRERYFVKMEIGAG